MSDHHQHHRSSPNLTTCLYTTQIGLFALTWSRSGLFTRSLHLHHHHNDASKPSFHLKIKPFPFTRKGSKKLNLLGVEKPAKIYYDLSGAKYGPGPEPISGFYITIVVDGEIVLLVGDCDFKEAQLRSSSSMVLKREHVYGTKVYSTKVKIGGLDRTLTIDCQLGSDSMLCFSVDGKRVLEIKHLKWKFRGNECIEIDGTFVQVSWDVYNWLFDGEKRRRCGQDGYALFMFTVFEQKTEYLEQSTNTNSMMSSFGFGFELEEKKMKRKTKKGGPVSGLLMRSGRTSSSSSLSSANSCGSCNSSVMEWANSEDEDQFASFPYSAGFSLLVYAWN